MYDLNTWLSDRNIHKIFFMKTLMHTNTSSKTTYNIKTSLIKQCYNAMHELGLIMLLILICCWYCYAADTDTVMLLILILLILILLCCWYTDTAGMYALYYMLNVPCLTSIYFTTVSRWNHAFVKSRSLKTKQSNILCNPLKSFKT
jgi:hypothetical protein